MEKGFVRFAALMRLVLGVVWIAPLSGLCAPGWLVPESPVRYRLDLRGRPTHPSAGYFATIPDGGVLRRSLPPVSVLTDSGNVVPSFVLWHSAENGLAFVFADPGPEVKSVSVYLSSVGEAKGWSADSGLTPSAILCAYPGRDNIPSAKELARLGKVDSGVHWAGNFGHGAPDSAVPSVFSISGDLSGRPRPGAFYLLSYVNAPARGMYWIAPVVRSEPFEMWVDGSRVILQERNKEWAGTGGQKELTAGLHRIEILQGARGVGPYSSDSRQGGLMYLTWKPPGENASRAPARILKNSEVVKSGHCVVSAVETREGTPLAVARVQPGFTYWFGNEEPLLLFEFSALSSGYPQGTEISWTFPDGATLQGEKVRWLVPGFREGKVRLTVRAGQAVSTSMVSYFGFSTVRTSLQNAEHRKAFRDVLSEMLLAYPRQNDPVGSWSDAWWNNIFRTLEGGSGGRHLKNLLTHHFEPAHARLKPAQLYFLEDTFLDLAFRDPGLETADLLKKFFLSTTDAMRQRELQFREAELQMYYLKDLKKAESIFTNLVGIRSTVEERARIRLGDLALLSGDLNKATSLYAEVQNRARVSRNSAPAAMGMTLSRQLLEGGPPTPEANAPAQIIPRRDAELRNGVLQEVSLSENVRDLIEQGFFLEARQALGVWEAEFPLSKISGDFILREAELFLKIRDFDRARPMLEAYCREIDASSYLPQAVTLLIDCVRASGSDPQSVRSIIEKVRDRMKYHPVAEKLSSFLSAFGAPAK